MSIPTNMTERRGNLIFFDVTGFRVFGLGDQIYTLSEISGSFHSG